MPISSGFSDFFKQYLPRHKVEMDYLAGILDMPRVGRGTETGGAPAVGEYRLGGAATTAVQDFAQAHGLTLATLIQLAWGRVLSSAVGQDDVAFGHSF